MPSDTRLEDLRSDFVTHREKDAMWKTQHLELHQSEMRHQLQSNKNTVIVVLVLLANISVSVLLRLL